jgi:H+/Cl- antiporter ClcA
MMLKRSTILTLRRAASIVLMLAIATAVATICIFVAHFIELIAEGSMTHITIADLIGAQVWWLRIPLCLLSPFIAFVALYLFFAMWSYAVRKDIEADGHPPAM